MNTHIANRISRQKILLSDVGMPRIILTMMFWHPGLTIALNSLMVYVLLNQLSLIHPQILHFLLNADVKFNILFARGRGHGSQLTRGYKWTLYLLKTCYLEIGGRDDDSDARLCQQTVLKLT